MVLELEGEGPHPASKDSPDEKGSTSLRGPGLQDGSGSHFSTNSFDRNLSLSHCKDSARQPTAYGKLYFLRLLECMLVSVPATASDTRQRQPSL